LWPGRRKPEHDNTRTSSASHKRASNGIGCSCPPDSYRFDWRLFFLDMKSPPAFQFYPDDFLAGTFDMTDAEVGMYIRLLCVQWAKGGISSNPEDIARFSRGLTTVQPDINRVLTKFQPGDDGLLRNQRLEDERAKQNAFRERQRAAGEASAKARFNRGSTVVQPGGEPKGNSPSSSPSSYRERDRERGTGGKLTSIPTVEDVIAKGGVLGVSEQDCRDWHRDMTEAGWADGSGVDIGNWARYLIGHRDRLRAEKNRIQMAQERGTKSKASGPEPRQMKEGLKLKEIVIQP
jgi:uncharacterized protein YdaU (DUF1376 family)